MLEKLIRKAVKKHRESAFAELLKEMLDIDVLEHELQKIVCTVDKKEAEEIVRAMKPYGEKWTMSEIRSFIESKNVHESEYIHYYLVMNMMFNDHHESGVKYGMDKPEFYFALSKEFIDDADAKPYKVERYFDD